MNNIPFCSLQSAALLPYSSWKPDAGEYVLKVNGQQIVIGDYLEFTIESEPIWLSTFIQGANHWVEAFHFDINIHLSALTEPVLSHFIVYSKLQKSIWHPYLFPAVDKRLLRLTSVRRETFTGNKKLIYYASRISVAE